MKPVFNKKQQLAEQIMKLLEGRIGNDAKYSFKEIELMVEQQLAYQIKMNLFSNYKVGEPINPGQYIVTFEDAPVKYSDSRRRPYIDLPAKYIDLPGGKGVWSIGGMENDFDKFIPLRLGSANFTRTQNVPFLQGNVGFEVEGMKAYFVNLNGIEKCLVQLVTTSTPDINITQDMDVAVIKGVMELLAVEKPSDKVDDNSEAR